MTNQGYDAVTQRIGSVDISRPCAYVVVAAAAAACGGGAKAGGGGSASPGTKNVVFATASHYACAGQSVVAADFDGDGVMDVAAGGGDGSACILFGRGDGTFVDGFEVHAPTWPAPGSTITQADVREFDANGDGIADLFVGTSAHVYLYVGSSTRAFLPPIDFQATDAIGQFALGDVDGDGTVDVVSSGGEFNSPYTYVNYLAKGAAKIRQIASLQGMSPTTVFDLNGDGRGDIVGLAARIALTGADGKPHAFQDYPMGFFADGFAVGDVNGDGVVDAVAAVALTSDESAWAIVVRLGMRDGTFGDPIITTQGITRSSVSGALSLGDIDGDGHLDLMVQSDTGFALFRGAGTGEFTRMPVNLSDVANLPNKVPIAFGDFDHDGRQDLAVLEGPTVAIVLNRTH